MTTPRSQRPRGKTVHPNRLDFFLWAFGFLEACVLLGVLWRCKRAARFPVFTTLIAFDVVREIALYFTLRLGSPQTYFYVFWSLASVDMMLQLGVVAELFGHVFRPLGVWAPDVRRSFALLAGICLVIASGLTWLATPPARFLRSAIVIRGNFFSSALMSELFVAMVALSVTMGLPWKTHVARLAQGFGVYSIFGIVTEGLHSYFGTSAPAYARVTQVRISLYCLCLAYWIVALARKEPESPKLPPQLRTELLELQRRAATLLQSFRELRQS